MMSKGEITFADPESQKEAKQAAKKQKVADEIKAKLKKAGRKDLLDKIQFA